MYTFKCQFCCVKYLPLICTPSAVLHEYLPLLCTPPDVSMNIFKGSSKLEAVDISIEPVLPSHGVGVGQNNSFFYRCWNLSILQMLSCCQFQSHSSVSPVTFISISSYSHQYLQLHPSVTSICSLLHKLYFFCSIFLLLNL